MNTASWAAIAAMIVLSGVILWRFWTTRYIPEKDPDGEINFGPLPKDPTALLETFVTQTKLARQESRLARHALERRVLNMQKLLVGFVILTMAFGISSVVSVNASHDAKTALSAQRHRQAIEDHDRCVVGNENRLGSRKMGLGVQDEIDGILTGLTGLGPMRTPTPEELAQATAAAKVIQDNRKRFLDVVNSSAFDPRDCNKLYPLPK